MNHFIHSCVLAIVFYCLYRLFLKGTTGFQWHRLYLLLIPAVSLVLPLLVIPLDQSFTTPAFLMPVETDVIPVIIDAGQQPVTPATPIMEWTSVLWITYFLGLTAAAILFIIKLARIQNYKEQGQTIYQNGVYITKVHDLPTAFSFMNHIYINDAFAEARYEQVLLHEITHIKQKHSWDLLFYELLRILFWFHPVPYLAQRELKMVHEHIADHRTIATYGKKSYYENLLKEALDCPDFSFTNPFFKSKTIKTRLTMIQKSQNQKFPFRKLLWMIPVLFASLIYTACTTEPETDIDIDAEMAEFSEGGKYADVTKEEFELIKKIKVYQLSPREEQKAKVDETFSLLEKARKDYKFLTTGAATRIDFTKNEKNEMITTMEFNDKKLYEAMIKTRFLVDLNQDELKNFVSVMNKEQEKITNNETKEFVEIEKLEADNKIESTDVPFAIIENVPTYPGCSGDNAEKKKCMQEKISKLVAKNFDTSLAARLGMSGKQKINTMFKINKDGNVVDIVTKAESPELQAEAARVIKMLPQMEPGSQRGQSVSVIYGLPIIFEISE